MADPIFPYLRIPASPQGPIAPNYVQPLASQPTPAINVQGTPNFWNTGMFANSGIQGVASPTGGLNPAVASGPAAPDSPWWQGGMFDNGEGAFNWKGVGAGIGAVKGLADSWLALQQLNLGEDQLAFQKDAFNKQYENQRTLTNAELEDRQRRRLSASPGGYQSVSDYMAKNAV